MAKINDLRSARNDVPDDDKGAWGEGDFGGSKGSRVPPGDFTIVDNPPPIHVIRPQWNGPVPLTFRATPMYNREEARQAKLDGESPTIVDHGRDSATPTGWSDWVRYGVPVASFVGKDEKITFITYDPRDIKRHGYNPRTNPYNQLYWGLYNANKAQEALVGGKDVFTKYWPGLQDRSNFKTSAFGGKPGDTMNFYQGLVFEYCEKRGGQFEVHTPCADGAPLGANKNDPTPVIQIKNTGATALDTALDVQGVDDPVSLTDGPFMSFFNPQGPQAEFFEDFDLGAMEGKEERGGWRAFVSNEFTYTRKRKSHTVSNDITEYEDKILENITWWDNVLRFPSHEEICVWLAKAFRSMPNLLRYTWKDSPEFFTDDVEGILVSRKVVSIPTDFSDDDDDTHVGSRAPARAKSSAIPETEDFDDEELEEEDALPSLEEDEVLDDDLFGLDEDESEEEEESAADETAHRRSRLRVADKTATPRRRQ